MHEVLYLLHSMSPYLLLGFLLAGIMHAFIPGRLYSRHLSQPRFSSVVKAALFGIPLPLCSCGVIPTAMSLRREGASRGAVTSFLIATPQTGVDSIIATYSLMGWPFALVRPIAALVTALWGGALVNVADRHATLAASPVAAAQPSAPLPQGFRAKCLEALHYAFVEMMQDIGKWLAIGIVVAGLITVFVPESAFALFRGNTLASLLLVLVIAMPMYLCATGSIPIAVALMLKGLTPGAGLVLLMAGPACNAASMLVVRKVLGTRTLLLYLLSIITGSVAFGYGIDYLQFHGHVPFLSGLTAGSACCHDEVGLFAMLCTALLCLLLLYALAIRPYMHNHRTCSCGDACHTAQSVYRVSGMSCNHCRSHVEQAARSLPGVEAAEADLATGLLRVEGTPVEADLLQAVRALGFDIERVA